MEGQFLFVLVVTGGAEVVSEHVSVTCRVGLEGQADWFLTSRNRRKLPWKGAVGHCIHAQEEARRISGSSAYITVMCEGAESTEEFVVYGKLCRETMSMVVNSVVPFLCGWQRGRKKRRLLLFNRLIAGKFSSGMDCDCSSYDSICVECAYAGSSGQGIFSGGWFGDDSVICDCEGEGGVVSRISTGVARETEMPRKW